MSSVTVLLVLAALSYGGCTAATSDDACDVIDETATCGEAFEFPLNVPENITQLHIHSTQVKSIGKNDFAQYNKLEVIDLSNCAITDIDQGTFTAQTNLNELNLAGNTEFSGEKKFIISSSLTKLNLSETGIETIPNNFFEQLPNLQELDLSSESLTELSISPFLRLTNLSTLIILKNSTFALNNFCNETNLQSIVFKIENGEDETHNCSKIIEENTTTAQEEITTTSAPIINQPESKTETTEVNQSIETTTVPTEHYGTTITVDNTEDTATVIVNPPVIEGTLETSDGKQKDNEEEQNKKEDDAAAADKKNEDQTHLVVENEKNETAKTDEPMTENVAIQTDEPTTEIVPAQPDNGPEEPKETTTGTNIAKDTHVFTNNTNSRKYNNIYSAAKPPDADGNAENKTSEVTSSAAQSSGTNVVLGIILTVMVIGAVGFGYKYWKNRRTGYRNANTEDTHEDGKELQTIVTHHTDPEHN